MSICQRLCMSLNVRASVSPSFHLYIYRTHLDILMKLISFSSHFFTEQEYGT